MDPLLLLAAPFCGAFISHFIGRKNEGLRDLFNILLTAGVLIGVLLLTPVLTSGPLVRHLPQLMGTGLDLRIGPLQYLMMLLTAGIWFITMMFLTQYVPTRKKRNRFHFFFLLTFGSTLGFFMTDNILNLFTFFEILSLSAYFLIIHDEDNASHEAGTLYLTMAILGGLAALLGILIAYEATGSLMIGEIGRFLASMEPERSIVGGLLFFGFAIKAGIYPLHIWLPKAYAAAPSPATAILTGILAKTGLYGLYTTLVPLTGSDPVFGWLAVVLGFVTLIHGGVLALMQRNVKRILSYSSMSQYGLILVGIGAGTLSGPEGIEAFVGAFTHMVTHSLLKVLLFLSIGLLYLKTQELSLNLIHGIGRKSRLLLFTLAIGIGSAWGLPGFTGSVSKPLIHEGLAHWAHDLPIWGEQTVEGLFVLGSALTVAYFLKLGTALFLDQPSDFSAMIWLKRRKRASIPMMILCALILTTGLYPAPLLEVTAAGLSTGGHLPTAAHGKTLADILTAALPLLLGALIHLTITRRFLRTASDSTIEYLNPSQQWLSLEAHFYGPLSQSFFTRTTALVSLIDSALVRSVSGLSAWLKAIDASMRTPYAPPVIEPPVEAKDEPKPQPPTETTLHQPAEKPARRLPVLRPKLKQLGSDAARALPALIEKTSGLTFALYLFGAFLVILLFMLVLYQS